MSRAASWYSRSGSDTAMSRAARRYSFDVRPAPGPVRPLSRA